MRSMTFLVNDRSTGSGPAPAVAVTITENSNGSLSVSLSVVGGVTGDLRGFFFDVANESRIGTLSVTPTSPGFTEFRQGNDSVKDLGNGANMNGLLGSDGGFDAGVEIGKQGIKNGDDYQSFSFTLKSSAGALTLDDFANVDFGVRVTSVGSDWFCGDRDRDGEAKLLETVGRAMDAKDDAGSVTEDAPVSKVTGNVFSNDLYLKPVHLITAVNGSASNIGDEIQGVYGSFRLHLDGSYTYTLDNSRAATQALAGGQQVVESFTYTAKNLDELVSVSTDTATVRITITGAADTVPNAAPVITVAVAAGAATELADNAPGEGVALHSATGTVDFTDTNLGDSHSVSVTAAAAGYLGSFSALVTNSATGDGAGTVTWTFGVADGAIEHLGAGESLTQKYTVTLNDGHGGTATQLVTITITGSNDAPTITSGTSSGAVAEDAVSTAFGILDFADLDLNDAHSLSVTPGAPGYLGTFHATVGDDSIGDGAGYVSWGFHVDNAAIQHLGAGDILTQVYTLAVDDGHGGTTTQDVTITITGSNDAPIITGGTVVFEPASGTINFTDVDLSDSHGLSVTPAAPGYLGTLNAALVNDSTGDGTGQVAWSFDVSPAAVQYLGAGDSLTQSYALTVDDGHGGTATQDVTITIAGVNDAPVIIAGDTSGSVFEDGSRRDSGQLVAQDVDQGDTLVWSVGGTGSQIGQYGTLSVNAAGEWQYVLNNGAPNVQQLAQGEHVADSFAVTVSDQHGASDTRTVSVDVAGSNDAPLIVGGATGGFLQEDAVFGVGSQLIATDADHGALLTWSVAPTTSLQVPGAPPGVMQLFGYHTDYHVTLDQLTITRDGATVFDDAFSDGIAPPSAPLFDGQPTSYLTSGAGYTESGGRLHLDGAYASAQRGIGNPALTVGQLAVLNTNIDPNDLTRGLKSDDDFKVEARFDLAAPDQGEVYGITLIDNAGGPNPPAQLGDSSMSLLVRRDAGGNLIVQLNDFDVVTDVGTTRQALALVPDAGDSQIVLRLVHDKLDPGIVHAEYDLIGTAGTRTFAFTQVAHVFGAATPGYAGDDENFTRVQLVAFGPDANAGTSSLQGNYGTLSVQQNGEWNYTLDGRAQQLAQGQLATDNFALRVTDEHGLSNFRTSNFTVVGSNDQVFLAIGETSGAVQEDIDLAASGNVAFVDVDHIDAHTAFVTDSPVSPLGSFSLGPVTESPTTAEGSVAWSYVLNNGAAQQLAEGQTVFETYAVTVADNFGSSVTQNVVVAVTGTNDGPVAGDDVVGGSGSLRVAVIGKGNGSIVQAAAQLENSTAFSIDADAYLLSTYSSAADWSALLAAYDVVVVGSSGDFDAPQLASSQLFPALRSFVDAGGGVVTTGWFTYDMNNMYGIGAAAAADADYVSPAARDSYSYIGSGNLITVLDPTHPITQGVSGYTVAGAFHELAVQIDPGATQLARPQFSNLTAIAYDEVGHGLTAYVGGLYVANPGYGIDAVRTGVADQIFEQAVAWVGGGGQSAAVDEDHVLTIAGADLLANDTDIDFGDTLSIYSVAATSALGATVTLGLDGNLSYDPTQAQALQDLGDDQIVTDTFTYTVSDGHGGFDTAVVSLTVAGVGDAQPNTPPTAVNDSNTGDPVIEQGVSGPSPVGDPQAAGNVLANDIDPDPNPGLHVTEVNGVAVGGVLATVVSGSFGTLSLGSDGQWTYQLDNSDFDTNALRQGETAIEQFTYTVADAAGATSSATLTVDITGSNDVPLIDPLIGTSGVVLEDGPTNTTTGRLSGLDPDHGAVLRYQLNSASSFSADYEFALDQFVVSRQRPGDTAPIVILSDDFTDGAPPPISPPYSNGQAVGYVVRGGFLEAGSRTILDGDLAQTTFNFGAPTVMVTNSALSLTTNTGTDPNAGLRITHDFSIAGRFDAILPGLKGQGYGIAFTDQNIGTGGDDNIQLLVRHDEDDVVRVVLREADAVTNSFTPISSLELEGVTDGDQIVLRLEHRSSQPGLVTGSFIVMDGDTGITTSYTLAGAGQIFGTETPGSTADDEAFTRGMFFAVSPATATTRIGTYGTITLDTASGEWRYTLDNSDPDTQALAAGVSVVDSFQPLVFDEFNTGSLGNIDITVFGANDAPVANADTAATDEDTRISINVRANDVEVDSGDDLQVVGFSPTTYGAAVGVNPDGTVWYDPTGSAALQALAAGESLTDTFTYTISDEGGATSTASVSVTVQGADEAAAGATGEVFEDGSRRASGQLTPEGVDTSVPLTWTVENPSVLATPDYRFLLDNLQIIRNGTQYFNDDFGNGAPPPAGLNLTGTTTPVSYAVTGGFSEGVGRAVLDGSLSVPIASVGTTDPFHANIALLLTDTTTNMAAGLKSDDNFIIEARFDLVLPDGPLQSYGIRLTDVQGNDMMDLRVRHDADGVMRVSFRDVDIPGNVITPIGSIDLAPLAGENQIVLRLTHDASSPGAIRASFDLLGGTLPHNNIAVPGTGQIFGLGTPGNPADDEVFTRVQVLAVAPSDHQNGIYGTLEVDANGEWSYALDNSSPLVQALAQGERVTDTFTVKVSDGLGGSSSQTVSVDVVGSNDAPIHTGPVLTQFNGGYVVEDGVHQSASGVALVNDPDHGADLRWSVVSNFGPAYSANYLVLLDDLSVTKNGAAFFNDSFNNNVPPPNDAPVNFSYLTSGAIAESSGRAVLNGGSAAVQRGVGIDGLTSGHLMSVNSNIDPADMSRGLKSDDDFQVAVRFDLSTPAPGVAYGFQLTDNVSFQLPPDQLGDSIVSVEVANVGGSVVVRLVERDVVGDTVTVVDSMLLTPLADETQIVLRAEHDAGNRGVVHAGFDLIGTGGTRHFDFAATGNIFGTNTPDYAGDDEDWTRVQVIALGPDTRPAGSSVQGTYGVMSIDPDSGAWTYVLNQDVNLPHGFTTVDTFNVRVVDEFGTSSTRQYNITVAATDDPAPTFPRDFFSANPGGDTWVGSAVNDTIAGGGGSDLLIGLGGSDTFDYNSLSDGTDTISDFTPGAGGDRLDLHDLLIGFGPGSNAFDFVRLLEFDIPGLGPSTQVQVNADGIGTDFVSMANLHGTTGLNLNDLLANGNLIL